MKLTCLTKGAGYHFPPSHILDLCGHRLLLECPLDLSAITIFSPIPIAPVDPSGLITAVPWYKTPRSLHLWDPSLIDAVLVSSPASMLGLPFLTRNPRFSGKVYATEATLRVGRFMMEELVEMHAEFVRFYGPDKEKDCPEWMKWEELGRLPLAVREVIMGEEGEDLGSWMPLYSAADVKECVQKVQSLKYAEEACHDGTLALKAFSSGMEIGSSNWAIRGSRRNLMYLSSSIFESAHAMGFDYHSLQAYDILLFSDLSSLNSMEQNGDYTTESDKNNRGEVKDPLSSDVSAIRATRENKDDTRNCLVVTDESSEEIDKMTFICSCVMDSVNEGGSVLIPIGRLGIVLLLLEQISQVLEASNLKVPIFMISTTAEETLAFANAMPEWLCKQRQEKLFSGEALFGHMDLIKEEKLYLFPLLYTPDLLKVWQEPCIVFSPHWSLRLGPSVHLLRRWHADHKCLLIIEQGVDAEAALMPFKAVAIKVLQCSFLSGIRVQKIPPLLAVLQPKLVLFPEDLQSLSAVVMNNKNSSYSVLHYSENATLRVPNMKEDFEAFLAEDLVSQLQPRRLTLAQKDIAIARLKGGKVHLSDGRYLLLPAEKKSSKQIMLHWGCVDPSRLLLALKEKGINGASVLTGDENVSDGGIVSTIRISVPEEEAVIETSATRTVIGCANGTLAALIYEALSSVSDGI